MVWKIIDDNRTRLTVLAVIKGSVAICDIFFETDTLFNLCFCNASGEAMQRRGRGRTDQDAH